LSKGERIVGYVLISIILFSIGATVGAKLAWETASKKSHEMESVNNLVSMKNAINQISTKGLSAHIEDIASLSVLILLKLNIEWSTYSTKHQKYVCAELNGIDLAFDAMHKKLKELNAVFVIPNEVNSIAERFSHCESNQQRNSDSGAYAPPPVR